MSITLWPHGLQLARLYSPSLSPRVCSNSCTLTQWCHPTISSMSAPFSSCLQSFQHQGLFWLVSSSHQVASEYPGWPMNWLFASGSQWISASASVLPMNIQAWFALGLSGLMSCCPRDSQESFPALQFESISSLACSLLYGPALTSIHDYWKTIPLTMWTFVGKVMSLLFKHCLVLS